MDKLKAAATRKLGPLPVWMWVLLAIAAWYLWKSFGGSLGGSSAGTQAGGDGPGGAGTYVGATGTGVPTEPTPPRRDPRTNPKNYRTVGGRQQFWNGHVWRDVRAKPGKGLAA